MNKQKSKPNNNFFNSNLFIVFIILVLMFLSYLLLGFSFKNNYIRVEATPVYNIITIHDTVFVNNDSYKLDEWQILEMAIGMTESKFNRYIEGKSEALGVFQITPIYIKEINRLQDNKYYTADAFDFDKSVEMFNIMQNNYNKDHDIDVAMKLHNPGGANINYYKKIYDNIAFIKKMEDFREAVLKNNSHKENI